MYTRYKTLVILTCLVFTGGILMAQTEQKVADLKAAFIYNFTKYIDWDADVLQNNFIITVAGTSPILRPLQEIARDNTIKGRKIMVKELVSLEDIASSNIVFIPENCTYPLTAILKKVQKGVLTVSENDGYGALGTAFNFTIVKEKLKFEANLQALKNADLKTSSQLLKLAIIIEQ